MPLTQNEAIIESFEDNVVDVGLHICGGIRIPWSKEQYWSLCCDEALHLAFYNWICPARYQFTGCQYICGDTSRNESAYLWYWQWNLDFETAIFDCLGKTLVDHQTKFDWEVEKAKRHLVGCRMCFLGNEA